MKRHSRRFRYALSALFVAVLLGVRAKPMGHEHIPPPPPPPVNHSHKFSLKYTVYAAGLKGLDASLNVDMSNTAYDIQLDAETEGFIGKLFPWSTSNHSSGRVNAKGELIPQLHTDRSTWKKGVSVAETHYDADGKAVKMTARDGDKDPAELPIDEKLAKGASDVLTSMFALLLHADSAHKCEGKAPVFDGKRRFDITLTDNGEEELQSSKYSRFSGKALRCTLKVVPVDGFGPKDMKRGWMLIQNYTEARNKPPTLWLAKAEGSDNQITVVHMEISSAYGAAVANLSD